jgi:hypothetical protein
MSCVTVRSSAVDRDEGSPHARQATAASTAQPLGEPLKRQAVALTVDRVMSIIGHELNQPLNVIAMSSFNGARMASRSTTTASEFDRRFRAIQDETRRAGALVHTAMQLTAFASPLSTDQELCPVSLLQDVVMPRLNRRGLSLSVQSTMPESAHCDRWLMMFVVLCGLERLEEDRSASIDDSMATAVCYCEYQADNREVTVGLRSTALLGRSASKRQSPLTSMLEALAKACGGQVIDEPGRWAACFRDEAFS